MAAAAGACSGDDAVPASPTPGGTGPPAAFLQAGAHDFVPGGIASYCWQGVCDETAPTVTTEAPLAVAPGRSLALVFEAGQPGELRVRWLDGAKAPVSTDGLRKWADADSRVLVAEGTQAPTRTGEYLVLAEASWSAGDVRYAFFVEVG